MTLNKIEEVEEGNVKTVLTDENGNFEVKDNATVVKTSEKESCKDVKVKERPKSAGSVPRVSFAENNLKKRPKSSCLLPQTSQQELERFKKVYKRKPKSSGSFFEIREHETNGSQWRNVRCESFKSLPEENCFSRPPSDCGSCLCPCRCCCAEDFLIDYSLGFLDHNQPKKCQSNPSFSRRPPEKCLKATTSESDFHKYKRSLKLLGFEPSDFGICDVGTKSTSRWKPKRTSSTFSTKINCKSISLDSLKETVRKAWIYDCLDNSHRKLLCQAAYEQWYFKKEEEFQRRREEERIKRMRARESLKQEFDKKREKAEEEFRKWVQRKRTKRKEKNESLEKKAGKTFSRLVKTKEESEKAFLKWKKEKDKELDKRMKEKKKEEEKKIESEKLKQEKKAEAEKAFLQWKKKLEETQKSKAEKEVKQKKKEAEMERRRLREENSQASYLIWKTVKDEEIKQRNKILREAARMAREERLVMMEERMYEAEQAFEEWLEKIEVRHKQYSSINSNQKKIPWTPA